MIIKILLVSGITGAVVLALRGTNSSTNQAIRRFAGVLFALAAALSVIFPDAVSWVANLVGVSRGTDLLLYSLTVASLYITVALYQRIHSLEQRLIETARELAITNAIDASITAQHAAEGEEIS